MDADKVKEFVYFSADYYPTRRILKMGAFALIFMDLLIGVIIYFGNLIICGVCLTIISMLYILFVVIVCNKKTVNTFQLRYLTTAISGILFATHFLLYASVVLNETNNNISKIILITLSIALIISLMLSILTILSVRKGYFVKVCKIFNSPTFITINKISLTLLPTSGLIGVAWARRIRNRFEIDSKVAAYISGIIFVIVSVALLFSGIFRFIQYYYARKFSITCGENGETTSPGLEPQKKVKKKKSRNKQDNTPKKVKKNWKSRPIFIKILIVIAMIIAIIIVVIFACFIYALIAEIISRITN